MLDDPLTEMQLDIGAEQFLDSLFIFARKGLRGKKFRTGMNQNDPLRRTRRCYLCRHFDANGSYRNKNWTEMVQENADLPPPTIPIGPSVFASSRE